MCYNVAFLEQKRLKLEERYKTAPQPTQSTLPLNMSPGYFVSGFDYPLCTLVDAKGLFQASWGLIPSWVKDWNQAQQIRNNTLNARAETLFEKASFRKAIIGHRAILPVSGFYEWHTYNKKKYPFFIRPKNDAYFSLACICDEWLDQSTGELLTTFSIITTEANSLMAKIHNTKKRMPLILEKQSESLWLNPTLGREELNDLMHPYGMKEMEAFSVSNTINQVRNERNVPETLQEVDYPELVHLP